MGSPWGATPDEVRRGLFIILDGKDRGWTFQFPINPEDIKMNRTANWVDHQIVGASHPRSQYLGGGARTINFTLFLDTKNRLIYFTNAGVSSVPLRSATTDRLQIGDTRITGRKKLIESHRFVEGLMLPRKFSRTTGDRGQIFYGPPPFMFCWGDFFRIRCIMRSVNTTIIESDKNLNPVRMSLAITLAEQPSRRITWDDYRIKGDTVEPPMLTAIGPVP